ncbi:gliding motility-associated C-terminal domain-containing protein [Flagellimonas olearia]|uniref:Gliding motility-associated C-terminal domain-containing protein n=1 Tax=Flagellimonas olearia TaxID=552546 RepID=A0A6I1E1H1_9FLAO|nr:gliding motility-associated C-terminal domain-containing protein [Allomuricauda olearia]KAB7529467.1 gliding motility-associated C-terminal domain-containing protein [Allomuricauda olearia]
MRNLVYIIIFLWIGFTQAQTALYNSGNLRVHAGTNMGLGLHTDLINDSSFDQNQGLVGFYGESLIQVTGSTSPILWDMEVMSAGDVFLQNPVHVENNTNFVIGNIQTPKNDQTVYLNFMDTGFFTGESAHSKVTGFAAVSNRSLFSFPVGDENQLRPLTLASEANSPWSICAYFFENPSSPTSMPQGFDIEEKVRDIGTVSDKEFWILQSDVPAKVTLSWNARSGLGLIPNATLESIIVVGWSKTSNQWTILGNSAAGGDIVEGFVVSDTFVPSDYEAITFGAIPLPTDTFAVNNPTLGNYFLSPNGDGVNDFLVIDGMEESPNNSLQIFNRLGQKVYEKINYVDEFYGLSNTGSLIMSQDIGLPEGVYYYLVSLNDLRLQYTGYLFLDR